LTGDSIGQNAAQLWAAFPDVRFEIRSHMASADGRFAAEWIMSGTNTGPFAGLPPTGRKVVLNGADFITVTDDGIRSVQGYFDAGEIPRQLDLQIVVQPRSLGAFTFGTGLRVSGQSSEQPGAISITSLIARNEKDVQTVGDYSRQIAAELPSVKGFLGLVAATLGERMITVSAWRNPDDPLQLMTGGTHLAASRAFYGPAAANTEP
jgi:SnoaL-like polyketide cyclase